MTIQRHFRGFCERKEFKTMFAMKKRLVKLLEPLVQAKLARKYAFAATKIQRMFRRYRDRRI